jgi:hypothetical protein
VILGSSPNRVPSAFTVTAAPQVLGPPVSACFASTRVEIRYDPSGSGCNICPLIQQKL